MDFKIAGSRKGITAMQLDVKLSDGVPSVILEEALDHARIGNFLLCGYFSLLMPYSLAVYVSHLEDRFFNTPRL
jgi:hypothetical protein